MTQAAPLCLVTRPEPEAARFAARVEAELNLTCLLSPLLKIEPCPVSESLAGAGTLILTSARGAEALVRFDAPKETPCFTVGDKTARIAQSLGYTPRSAGGDAEALVRLVEKEKPQAPLIHIRGAHSRGDIAARLTESGLPCREIIAYRQVKQDLSAPARHALEKGATVVAPLFSPRTAQAFRDALPPALRPLIVALSPAVAESFGRADAVAAQPTEDALLSAMADLAPIRAWVEQARLRG